MSSIYYKRLDIIRIIACVAVLLYHLNILPGGFLAVVTFFTLTSYLSFISMASKEKFSLIDYYKKLILKTYIPLLSVIFLTLFVVFLYPKFFWLNLKPEVTSIILGYNNFWQLSVNLDYFARHLNSPFMHFWYMAILLQFDLICPYLFLLLKKLGDKIHKIFPVIITFILTIIFTYIFINSSTKNSLMFTYYNTLTRIFPCFLGLFLGTLSFYYQDLLSKIFKSKFLTISIFYLILLSLIMLFIKINSTSKYWVLGIIISAIISGLLIIISSTNPTSKLNILDKVLKYLSSITYFIYLVQYPLIYFFQSINLKSTFKITIIIILTLIISMFMGFAFNYKNKEKKKFSFLKIIKYLSLLIILIASSIGIYEYIITKDYTEDMEKLEAELSKNAELLEAKQAAYSLKKEEEDLLWAKALEDMENGKEKLKEVVTNLNITGVGDSVMLGAIGNLYDTFPNGYFDAKISRTAWVVNDILSDLKAKNILGDVVVLNLGANGDCSEECKDKIMQTLEGKEVFWLNVTNDKDVHVNERLASYANNYPNLHIIDWANISNNHPEYFVSDGIHLTKVGRLNYTQAIYDAIYNLYLSKYEAETEQKIFNHEQEFKNKLTFYGNDLLLNIMPSLEEIYQDAIYNINKEYNYLTLKEELITLEEDTNLTNKIVLIFDKTANITIDNYLELATLFPEKKLYIVLLQENSPSNLSNLTFIDFYQELLLNKDYLMYDSIHLSLDANQKLVEILENIIE